MVIMAQIMVYGKVKFITERRTSCVISARYILSKINAHPLNISSFILDSCVYVYMYTYRAHLMWRRWALGRDERRSQE